MQGRIVWGNLVLALPLPLDDETTIVLRGPEPATTAPLRLTKCPALRPAFVRKRTARGPTPPTLEQLAALQTQMLMGTASGVQIHSRDVQPVRGAPDADHRGLIRHVGWQDSPGPRHHHHRTRCAVLRGDRSR